MGARGFFDLVLEPEPEMVAQGYFMLKEQLDDLETPLREIAHFISQELATNFQVGGRPRWAPLRPSTVQKKGHSTALIQTSRLRNEVSDPGNWAGGKAGNTVYLKWSPPSSVDEYGHFHLSGTRFMAQRDFMSLPGSVQSRAEQIFDRWLQQAMSI